MGKINPSLYSSNRHDWETPPWLWQAILSMSHSEKFWLDPCSTRQNIPALDYFTLEQDGLKQKWYGVVFMNPPYGRELPKWAEKAYNSTFNKEQFTAVWGLIPARPDTKYWHDYVFTDRSFVVFLKGRLKFINPDDPNGKNDSAPFPTALVYWGSDHKQMLTKWLRNPPIKGTLVHVPSLGQLKIIEEEQEVPF